MSLAQRKFDENLTRFVLEQIEDDEGCWMRCGQFSYTAGGRMETKLKFIETETALHRNDELAVDDKISRRQSGECFDHIGKVARERLPGFGLQKNLVAATESDAPEAIPFGFILPVLAGGN